MFKPALLVAALSFISHPLLADEFDPCHQGLVEWCALPDYLVVVPPEMVGAPECPGVGLSNPQLHAMCRTPAEAPGAFGIECHADGSAFDCQAWPQGDSLIYSWEAAPHLLLQETSPTQSPFQRIGCRSSTSPFQSSAQNVVTVHVTSPYDVSSTTSITLNCPSSPGK